MSLTDEGGSSLLRRAMANEPEAWRRLVNLYEPLVHRWCQQWGIPEHEIADVSQEVFAAVAASLGSFRSDPTGLNFRAWIRGITRHKLQHHSDDRREPAIGGSDAQIQLQQIPAPASEGDLSESPSDIAELYHRALRQVKHQVEHRTWSAFWRVTIDHCSTAEVATELGISANAVRLAKSHVLRRLREEMGELIA